MNVAVNDTGNSIYAEGTTGNLAFFDETYKIQMYNVLQFHIHAPSEHTIDGKHYDLELHIVHQNTRDSNLAVLGVFFDRSVGTKDNDFLTNLIANSTSGNSTSKYWKVGTLPLMNLVTNLDSEKIYHYQGSLTTPPCTETVSWIVVDDPQPISQNQLNFFNSRWMGNKTFADGYGNNRIVQPLNDRHIYFYRSFASSAINSIAFGFGAIAVSAVIGLIF